MMRDEQLEQVHQLYVAAYEVCMRARDQGKQYVGFRLRKGELQLFASQGNNRGESSHKFDMLLPDWAANVLYRLVEAGFVDDDLPLDEYFEAKAKVGYE